VTNDRIKIIKRPKWRNRENAKKRIVNKEGNLKSIKRVWKKKIKHNKSIKKNKGSKKTD
jgi:hypothetical protein